VTCDAFFGIDHPVTGLEGAVLRALSIVPGLRVGKTFKWVVLADRRKYLAWLEAMLAREQPRVLHLSHGARIEDDALPALLADAARRALA
jgi:hypothetical protein